MREILFSVCAIFGFATPACACFGQKTKEMLMFPLVMRQQ